MKEFLSKISEKRKTGTLTDALRRKIYSKICLEKNHDTKNTIFLSANGRSGSTWISDIINYNNSFRYMFEPFYSKKVDLCSHFLSRQYLHPKIKKESYLKPAELILSGKVKHPWIDRFNKKFLCGKRLIKDIRTNLIVKWLKVHFPKIKLILLTRLPCAVANSRMRLGWGQIWIYFYSKKNL
ncbi:MAG: hypothetical protein ACTSSG_14210 [Candidatus Heimdallarchaeaceae archaeon]